MDNCELLLTPQAEENIEETLSTLITAANDIATATESDFERIESKKWYKRLWELVTFNKDNQKIQARGVGNLAKLNEITMKAIVLVSKQSKAIAERLTESINELSLLNDNVNALSEQQLNIIKTLQKIKRGFETEERFDELSENQRDIIFAVLRKYATEGSNEDTGKLLAVLRKSAHETYDEIDYDVIENALTQQSSHKILYTVLQTFSVLLTDELADDSHEIFNYISLSNKTKNTIANRVKEDINIYGKNEYIKFFECQQDDDWFIDDDEIFWSLFENDDTITNKPENSGESCNTVGCSAPVITQVFRMEIENVLTLFARGTVFTGKIDIGNINIGDTITVEKKNGQTIDTKITQLEMSAKSVNAAKQGDNIALSLDSVDKNDIDKGDIIVKYETVYGKASESSCSTESLDGSESTKIEPLYIKRMLNIPEGETVRYENKEIHIESLINCSGTLELYNCVILYNEKNVSDEIKMEDNGKIYASNCTFVCKSIDTNHFITLNDNTSAMFEKCVFVDCSYFITGEACNATLNITDSEIYNCMRFARCHSITHVDITSINIIIDKNIKFNVKSSSNNFVFYVSGNGEHRIDKINVSDESDKAWNYISFNEGSITNSAFNGIKGKAVSAGQIVNCSFTNCSGKHSTVILENYFDKAIIKLCTFDNCTGIIETHSQSEIKRCYFVNCTDSLIYSYAPSEISSCEFINYVNTAKDGFQGDRLSNPVSAIELKVNKSGVASKIENCVFDGININEGFLVKGEIYESISGNTAKVRNCDFKNCTTKRTSGKLIKEWSYYYGLFGKTHDEEVISVANCRGLDLVNKPYSISKSNTGVSKCSSIGSKLGTVTKYGAAMYIGGPVGVAVTAAYDMYRKKKKKEEDEKRFIAESE